MMEEANVAAKVATAHGVKREMSRPRSNKNRKRARCGGKTTSGDDEIELQIDILPLELGRTNAKTSVKRIRVVRPYPFTFSTFAKARWIGRSIVDVYHQEFGSYPRSYYESAISEGRIMVSGKKVSCDYKVVGGDELTHTVHRHEPAVAICNGALPSSREESTKPLINVLHVDDQVLVVDKPSTLPIHPCGGYNFNSLFHILSAQDPTLKGALRTVHRLDRLTSGLTIIAKTKDGAKKISKCIVDREKCQKIYVARVKGKFPLQAPTDKRLAFTNGNISCKYGEDENNGQPVCGYWITDCHGIERKDQSLADVFESSRRAIDDLLGELDAERSGLNLDKSHSGEKNKLWFHLAVPCRIASHKNGVCEAGEFSGLDREAAKIKPAQTAFAVVEYDQRSDSTVVLVKPETGRMHQIRLHCQYLQHPIANDLNYGGKLWYDDPAAEVACKEAQEKMNQMDSVCEQAASRPENALSTDVPASETEISNASASSESRTEDESLLEFIKKTCVWCARSRGGDRTLLEFLVRSRGIWLHALRYRLDIGDAEVGEKILCYKTDVPEWADLSS